jgi:hypothetical protein
MKKGKKYVLYLALGAAILTAGFSALDQKIHTADEEWPRIIKSEKYS